MFYCISIQLANVKEHFHLLPADLFVRQLQLTLDVPDVGLALVELLCSQTFK